MTKYIIFFVSGIFLLNGCASSTRGADQRIIVSTPGAPGATCRVVTGDQQVFDIVSPETIQLKRNSGPVIVTCQKKCFYSEQKTFYPTTGELTRDATGIIKDVEFITVNAVTQKSINYSYDFIISMKYNRRCRGKGAGFLDGNPEELNSTIDDFSFDALTSPQISPKSNVIKDSVNNPDFKKTIHEPARIER